MGAERVAHRVDEPLGACALEDGEDERVDHPEQAHDDGQGEQDVEQVEELGNPRGPFLDPCALRSQLGVGEAGERPA